MRVDCRNLQELQEHVADLSHGDRLVLLTDKGALRLRINDNGIDFHESDEKGNLLMSELIYCPECGHPKWDKDHSDCTYESIAGEASTPSELQLLVIDLGDCCVVKVEKGNFDWSYCIKGGCFRAEVGAVRVHDSSFPELRSAIDGEKPVPRIETELNQSGYTDYILRYKDGDTICVQFLTQSQFTTLSELAGKPLPIYECGKWERLDGKFNPMDAYGELPVKVWRYRRD